MPWELEFDPWTLAKHVKLQEGIPPEAEVLYPLGETNKL